MFTSTRNAIQGLRTEVKDLWRRVWANEATQAAESVRLDARINTYVGGLEKRDERERALERRVKRLEDAPKTLVSAVPWGYTLPGRRAMLLADDIAQHVKDQTWTEQHQRGYLNAKACFQPPVSIPLDDDIQQHGKDQQPYAAPKPQRPGVTDLLYVEPCIRPFRYGQRVQNTVTQAFGDKVARREWSPERRALLRRIQLMSRGTIIPRPDGCPMLKQDRLQVYVLCDDGKVRGTRASFLK